MDEQLGTMINTQPAPQEMPDQNAASLVAPQGQQVQPMHPDQAFAALGFATHISNQALMAEHGRQEGEQPSDATEEPQDAPGGQETPKEDKPESDMETRLLRQIDDLREEIRNGRQDDKLDKIRDEVSSLAKDDGAELQ